jgi:uncharacterized protein
MDKTLRIVLDTNALLMSLPRKSPYRPIFDAFLSGKILLLIDNGILSEYLEILEERTDSIVAQNIAELLINSTNVIRVNVNIKWLLINNDPDDDKFVDCAVAGSADYLVTNDKHFNVLKALDFPPVPLISVDAFLKVVTLLFSST